MSALDLLWALPVRLLTRSHHSGDWLHPTWLTATEQEVRRG